MCCCWPRSPTPCSPKASSISVRPLDGTCSGGSAAGSPCGKIGDCPGGTCAGASSSALVPNAIGVVKGPQGLQRVSLTGTPCDIPALAGGVTSLPSVLLSGHHGRIARCRREQALALTARRRPDLIAAARAAGRLSRADEACLKGLGL